MTLVCKNDGLVLPGLEPGTFRVLSERDNHYTTELMMISYNTPDVICSNNRVIISQLHCSSNVVTTSIHLLHVFEN